jgi:hypothetical protein
MNNRPLALTLALLLSASLLGCASPLSADPTLPPGKSTPPTAQPAEPVCLCPPRPEVARNVPPSGRRRPVRTGERKQLICLDLYRPA